MALTPISQATIQNGYTGVFSVDKGDILYSDRNRAEAFKKLTAGPEGSVLTILRGLPVWSKDGILNAIAGTALTVASLTTDSLKVDNLGGVLKATAGTVSGSATTSDLPEGTNLYWTQSRFDTAFALKTTTDLAEGTNLYYTQARFDTAFTLKSTTDLDEGSNLYFTTSRVDDEIHVLLGFGTVGQVLATNATVDGYEWITPPGAGTGLSHKQVMKRVSLGF
jgi:hypothetical protein